MLSTDELETYKHDGLVIPTNFRLNSQEVTELQNAVEDVIQRNPDTPPDQLLNLHLRQGPPFNNVGHAAFGALATHPGILALVEQLLGPDLIVWASQLFCKPPAVGREVPWHQDSRYWAVRPLVTCSVWVAIDESASDNGALKFIPGSHGQGDFSHRTDNSPHLVLHQAINDQRFDEAKARYVEMAPGQISLHHSHLVHGSAANKSGRRRAGIAIRYMPTTSKLDTSLDMSEVSRLDWSVLPLLLVRGVNRNAGNDEALARTEGQIFA